MPYIYRDTEGEITGFSKWKNDDSQEFMAEDHEEMVEFKKEKIKTKDEKIEKKFVNDEVFSALVDALNDGSFVPGGNLSKSEIEAIISSKMK